MTQPRVLKHGAGAEQAEAFSFADVEAEARAILARARAQARRVAGEAIGVLDEARKAKERNEADHRLIAAGLEEVERRKKAGFEEGRKAGLEAGRVEGKQLGLEEGRKSAYEESYQQALAEARAKLADETAQARALLDELLEIVQSRRDDLTSGAYARLLDLAVEIASKVVGRRLEVAPETVLDAVRSAVDLSLKQGEVVIRLHPDDAALLEKFLPELREGFRRIRSIALEPDSAIARGGCVVTAAGGEVDAQIQTRLDEIRRQLKD